MAVETGSLGTQHFGLGTRIVEALVSQIEGHVKKTRSASGYALQNGSSPKPAVVGPMSVVVSIDGLGSK